MVVAEPVAPAELGGDSGRARPDDDDDDDDDDVEICVICQDSLVSDASALWCGHRFHGACVEVACVGLDACPYRCETSNQVIQPSLGDV